MTLVTLSKISKNSRGKKYNSSKKVSTICRSKKTLTKTGVGKSAWFTYLPIKWVKKSPEYTLDPELGLYYVCLLRIDEIPVQVQHHYTALGGKITYLQGIGNITKNWRLDGLSSPSGA